jgi:16S rRNA (guanine527-N7)-methyltransferase
VTVEGDAALVTILERAQARGSLGPGRVEGHLRHARGFAVRAEALLGGTPGRVVDLGSGAGVPGLVLAQDWADARVTLVDAQQRRAEDLEAATHALGFGPRVTVLRARAEDVAHRPEFREAADLVTARSFGPPPLTAEIAAGLVRVGGWLIVSEPPGGDPERWPSDPLAALGFGPAVVQPVAGGTYAGIPKIAGAPSTTPRPTRRLVKSPAW